MQHVVVVVAVVCNVIANLESCYVDLDEAKMKSLGVEISREKVR